MQRGSRCLWGASHRLARFRAGDRRARAEARQWRWLLLWHWRDRESSKSGGAVAACIASSGASSYSAERGGGKQWEELEAVLGMPTMAA